MPALPACRQTPGPAGPHASRACSNPCQWHMLLELPVSDDAQRGSSRRWALSAIDHFTSCVIEIFACVDHSRRAPSLTRSGCTLRQRPHCTLRVTGRLCCTPAASSLAGNQGVHFIGGRSRRALHWREIKTMRRRLPEAKSGSRRRPVGDCRRPTVYNSFIRRSGDSGRPDLLWVPCGLQSRADSTQCNAALMQHRPDSDLLWGPGGPRYPPRQPSARHCGWEA